MSLTESTKMTPFDESDLIERLMGNDVLAKRLARGFIESMPRQLTSLAAAISNLDSQATQSVAHSIKGAAANMATPTVRDIASRLEKLGEAGDTRSAQEVLPQLVAAFDLLRPILEHYGNSKP